MAARKRSRIIQKSVKIFVYRPTVFLRHGFYQALFTCDLLFLLSMRLPEADLGLSIPLLLAAVAAEVSKTI